MYASLGNVQFQLLPLTDLEQKIGFEYAEHKVIEGKPLLQFTGDNLDELNISLRFHFTFCEPETEFEKLKAEAALHQALPFLFASGRYLGRFVVTELTRTFCATADTGRILDLQVRLCLKEWTTREPLAALQSAQREIAPALSTSSLAGTATPAPAPGNRAACISGEVTRSAAQMKKAAAGIAGFIDQVQAQAAQAAADLRAALSGITATVAPIMAQAKLLADDAEVAATLIRNLASDVSSYSSAITRITSGLPGPLGKVGERIESLNRQIFRESTKAVTVAEQARGGAIEAGTRAQMIARMLP